MTDPVDEVFDAAATAALYDHFNPWSASDDFYLALARESGGDVLDLGCGTGMLACRMAAAGLRVTGADPARGMLAVARTRAGADAVTWFASNGQSLDLPRRFDLIYMTGHAFQAVLTDADQTAVLAAAARHLKPDGRMAFETRNPARRAWLDWTPERDRSVAEVEGHGRVEETHDARENPSTGLIDITARYRFLDRGGELVGRSRLRFIGRDHLAGLLAAAGLAPLAWYGDWDRAPFTDASPEIIVVAGLADRSQQS